MDNYPEEFTELQKRPNEELQGRGIIVLRQSHFLFSI